MSAGTTAYSACALPIYEERIYEPAQLTAMLEQAGFTEIKTYGDQSFAPVQGGEDRIYFTARKRD